MGSMKSPCTTSCRSSIETIALNCLRKQRFFCILATDRQTDRQTNKQRTERLNIRGLCKFHVTSNTQCNKTTETQNYVFIKTINYISFSYYHYFIFFDRKYQVAKRNCYQLTGFCSPGDATSFLLYVEKSQKSIWAIRLAHAPCTRGSWSYYQTTP